MFRFTVRDLFWLMLVVAVALGWFVRERQLRGEADTWKNRYLRVLVDVLGPDSTLPTPDQSN